MSSPENFQSPEHRARLPNAKAAGLSALTHAAMAAGRPLDAAVDLYAGSMWIQGLVAPPSWMLLVTIEGARQEIRSGIAKSMKRKSEAERQQAFDEMWAPHGAAFADAQVAEDEQASAGLELTLVNAKVLPAMQTGNGKSGGHRLPVVRVPLASVDVWWIIQGETIKGTAGWSGSFGVLFPVDLS